MTRMSFLHKDGGNAGDAAGDGVPDLWQQAGPECSNLNITDVSPLRVN